MLLGECCPYVGRLRDALLLDEGPEIVLCIFWASTYCTFLGSRLLKNKQTERWRLFEVHGRFQLDATRLVVPNW